MLDNRMAICSNCDRPAPSDPDLPLFQYRGSGSRDADRVCLVCGYFETAHPGGENYEEMRSSGRPTEHLPKHGFVPHGAFAKDLYYCGCKGWD